MKCDNCHNLQNEVWDLMQKIEQLEQDLVYKEDECRELQWQLLDAKDEISSLEYELDEKP